MPPVYRALSTVSMGQAPSVQAGETIPEKFLDPDGNPQPVDFDRLIELGVVIEDKVAAQADKEAADAAETARKAAEKAAIADEAAVAAQANAARPASPKPAAKPAAKSAK